MTKIKDAAPSTPSQRRKDKGDIREALHELELLRVHYIDHCNCPPAEAADLMRCLVLIRGAGPDFVRACHLLAVLFDDGVIPGPWRDHRQTFLRVATLLHDTYAPRKRTEGSAQ